MFQSCSTFVDLHWDWINTCGCIVDSDVTDADDQR